MLIICIWLFASENKFSGVWQRQTSTAIALNGGVVSAEDMAKGKERRRGRERAEH